MRKQKQKVLEALSKLDLEISDKDFGKYVDSFIKDLKDGLAGKSSSLKILPSFIKFPNQIPNQERIAVLAAGKVTLSKGNFQVSGEKSKVYGVMGYPMPGLGKELTIEGYFHQIINDARDVLRNCNKIGFCFRHAIEVNSKWDARLLEWSRAGVNVHGLEGRYIGEEFKKCLREASDKDYKILLLNDTVATLIAGLSEACEKEFEDFIGLVHSSGYNLSYIENGKNITSLVKDKKYLKTQMVLNTQAGSFSKIKDSKVDKKVRANLRDMVIGEFSQKVNSDCLPIILRELVKEFSGKLLSPKISRKLEEIDDMDLEQMYAFLRVGLKSSLDISSIFRYATLEDAANLGVIIDQILQRAARLVAIQLCGILKYKDIGHNPIQPVGIIVEGDFFDIVKDFEYRVRHEIAKYFKEADERYLKFLYVPNAPLLGAGMAAAMNL